MHLLGLLYLAASAIINGQMLTTSQTTTITTTTSRITPAPLQCWSCDSQYPRTQPAATRRCLAGYLTDANQLTCPPASVCGIRYDTVNLDELQQIVMRRVCLTVEEEARIISDYPYSHREPLVCDKWLEDATGEEVYRGYSCVCQGKLCNRFSTYATNVAVNNVGMPTEQRQEIPLTPNNVDTYGNNDYYYYDDDEDAMQLRSGALGGGSIDSIMFGETIAPEDTPGLPATPPGTGSTSPVNAVAGGSRLGPCLFRVVAMTAWLSAVTGPWSWRQRSAQ
ncbi:uncharacterized protein LOC129587980 [Paramacrobiotus metropolitanus]|uniref:uncharacterized protein LOC129587980 n=1 Tax=Paramacrobiotus metropolitanus TaxID=2943436 RepID=UPI0024458DB6|nr:uncharacterized protein LOC129587980 [Paramacrobiotus metropolitanus]